MTNSLKLLFGFQIISTVLLFLYSFTQVDLGLTLSQVSIFQTLQRDFFQQIGFFNRPLSSALFIIILICMFVSYLGILYLSYKEKINRKTFWSLLLITSGIIVLSYNAFSYDLFNYIFDAKIVTHYGQSPYFHKALDYPNDPMLSFMRWTHRLYPYGPAWLGITIPLSFAGMNIFIITFFLFKLAIGAFFLGTVYFLEKIIKVAQISKKMLALSLFAFNPLVLIESLNSSHNDIAMMFFAIFGVYLFLTRRIVFSILAVIASYLVKSVSILLLVPILAFSSIPRIKEKFTADLFFKSALVLMIVGFFFVSFQPDREIQPWYSLWILPFVSLVKLNKYIISFVLFISLGMLLTYLIPISQGNYENIIFYKRLILLTSVSMALLASFSFTKSLRSKLEL